MPAVSLLDGSERLRERPLGTLAAALVELGGRVEWLGKPGRAPLRVVAGGLDGGVVTVDSALSSQFVSALLMAGCRARGGLEVRAAGLRSAPYVDLTLQAVERFGGDAVALGADRFRVRPGPLRGARLEVEPDASAACYPAAAAALTGGDVELVGLRRDSRQGDAAFLELLARMGAAVTRGRSSALISGTGTLNGIDADLGGMPDQVPTLAALAPFAAGTTRITNVPHLRLKESDRLAAMAGELRRLGAVVRELDAGLEIDGGWADGAPPTDPVVVATHGDHRIAMSLALVALRRPGVTVADPDVVAKSYPRFWNDLETLLAT